MSNGVFSQLANRGIQGLATYEPGLPIEEVARELGFGSVDEITKLASNENSLGPSPLALNVMRTYADQMHRYPDGSAFFLKRAIAAHLDVQPENVLPGNGSNELIEFLGHVFLRPGRNIVMADRAFAVYRLVAAMFGAEVRDVPMARYVHDLDAMHDAIGPETSMVFIANPNNPTGTAVQADALARFVDRLPDGVICCLDEAYVELLPEEDQMQSLAFVREGRPVVVLRTFSKVYGLAGLRVGYAIAPVECIQLLNRVRQPFNVNAMALKAAEAALGDVEHVQQTRDLVRNELGFFYGELDLLGIDYVPSSANFLLIRTGQGREVFDRLQREGVIVRPMDVYGLPDHIRITVGTREENQRCILALATVLQSVAQNAASGSGE